MVKWQNRQLLSNGLKWVQVCDFARFRLCRRSPRRPARTMYQLATRVPTKNDRSSSSHQVARARMKSKTWSSARKICCRAQTAQRTHRSHQLNREHRARNQNQDWKRQVTWGDRQSSWDVGQEGQRWSRRSAQSCRQPVASINQTLLSDHPPLFKSRFLATLIKGSKNFNYDKNLIILLARSNIRSNGFY